MSSDRAAALLAATDFALHTNQPVEGVYRAFLDLLGGESEPAPSVLNAIHSELRLIEHALGGLMTTQDQINADVTAINNAVTDIAAQAAEIGGDVQAIKAALAAIVPTVPPGVDLSALDAAVAKLSETATGLDEAVSGLGDVVPAPAPAPTDEEPAPTAPAQTEPPTPTPPGTDSGDVLPPADPDVPPVAVPPVTGTTEPGPADPTAGPAGPAAGPADPTGGSDVPAEGPAAGETPPA